MASILVVSDHDRSAAYVSRRLPEDHAVRLVPADAGAVRALAPDLDFRTILITLPHGKKANSAFAIFAIASKQFPRAQVGIIADECNRALVNAAALRGATLICTPFGQRELQGLLARSTARSHGEVLREALARTTARFRLSPREHQILSWLTDGGTRGGYVRDSGVSANTVKAQIRGLLAKTSAPDTKTVVTDLLRLASTL
jgi:DNA-binding NarL/FixJ family response regulator